MNVAAILKDKGRSVCTASPDASLLDIAKVLAEKRIGCIVLLDDDEKVAGIVSERDLVRTLAGNGPKILEEPVVHCMTRDVVSCRESDTIDRIMAQMTSRRFRHMPVVENGRLVGLVSIGDVVKQRIAEAEMEAAAMRDYIATG